MFGFGRRKKQEKEKKKSKIDKLIMGAIVGGAVGSVIGMSIAPQKGKDTREMLAQKGKELIKKGQEFSQKIKDEQHKNELDHSSGKYPKKKLLGRVADKLFRRKKKDLKREDFRRIPNEVE